MTLHIIDFSDGIRSEEIQDNFDILDNQIKMVYNKDITMNQNFFLTINKDLPDCDYIIRTLADNVGTYNIQINFESGLTPIGFTNNIQLGGKTGYVVLRKQGSLLILLETYKESGVN